MSNARPLASQWGRKVSGDQHEESGRGFLCQKKPSPHTHTLVSMRREAEASCNGTSLARCLCCSRCECEEGDQGGILRMLPTLKKVQPANIFLFCNWSLFQKGCSPLYYGENCCSCCINILLLFYSILYSYINIWPLLPLYYIVVVPLTCKLCLA